MKFNYISKKLIKLRRSLPFNKEMKEKKRTLEKPRKLKALLIGINYKDTLGELRGCINDVRKIHKLLQMWNYTEVMILTEEDELKPTKENILKGFDWLCEDNESYDKVFLHYSGHGSWLKDITSDEIDGRDECLVPLDYQKAGMITDDVIHTKLANRIKTDFIGIIDACHSGSMLDLKYNYHMITDFKTGNKWNMKNYTSDYVMTEHPSTLECDNTFLMISGCKDEQTSADAYLDNTFQGALSHTFYQVLRYNRFNINIQEMMKQIHVNLKLKNFEQRPVISSNKPVRMNNIFRLI